VLRRKAMLPATEYFDIFGRKNRYPIAAPEVKDKRRRRSVIVGM
jgi:hypothetical protein